MPQNLGNQIVITVINAKLQQSSDIFLLRSLPYMCSNESQISDNGEV